MRSRMYLPQPTTFPSSVTIANGLLCSVFLCCWSLVTPAVLLAAPPNDVAENKSRQINFQRDVQPILQTHCNRCHGQKNQEASLALNTRADFLGVADSDEPIVTPGDASTSLLLSRVTDDSAGDIMPLDGAALSEREILTLRTWIEQGAVMPEHVTPAQHWAYAAPKVDQQLLAQSTQTHPVDLFVAQQLKAMDLSANPPADPRTIARRVSLALTGLPATIEQAEQFANDPSEKNYERLVDELLASNAFGVHWARHWLDLARYADSNGFQADQLRDSWAYRDWVVNALNEDKPFDRFVTEQLAGDLLPDADEQTRIATGFHRTPTCNVEAGVHPEANRVQQVFDRVNTTGTVFLGTTMECAQCHDHKYDPFTQKDYYQLFAYFNNTPLEVKNTSGVTWDFYGPTMPLPLSAPQANQHEALTAERQALQQQRQKRLQERSLDAWITDTKRRLQQYDSPRWVSPRPKVTTTGGETHQILDDNSVLISGAIPKKNTVYRFQYNAQEAAVLAVRLDALRHDSLPGKGPGRGDKARTNFVLHELTLRTGGDQPNAANNALQRVTLMPQQASFSQGNYDFANAVDGKLSTAWAIAPQFTKEHWSTYQLAKPLAAGAQQTLVVELDQRYGQGRVLGRPKVSFLIGDPRAPVLPAAITNILRSEKPLTGKQRQQLQKHFESMDADLAALDQNIAAIDQQLNAIKPPTTLVMIEQERRETFVMQLGDYQSLGDAVGPGPPASLHALPENAPANRLGLAQWLVDPANPLLARVTVNRFWAEIFGRGIVATPEDFGTQSQSPTHPELLDWLALEFQRQDWSVKAVLKTLVMSESFRRDSKQTEQHQQLDANNSYLARGPRFRLPAETIRDNALAVAGLLCQDQDGPPIMPYQPDGIWRAVGRNQPKWKAADDQNRFRRGLYVVWKRGAPYPNFVAFDAPDRAACTVKRPRTNTPLQALALLNDRVYAEVSIGLAARMMREAASQSPDAIASYGFQLATLQTPTSQIRDALLRLYQSERERIATDEKLAKQRLSIVPAPMKGTLEGLDQRELAAWYAVASVLLNLDVTITQN